MKYTREELEQAFDKGMKLFDILAVKYGEKNAENLCSHRLLTESSAYFSEDMKTLESLADKLALINGIKTL